MLFTNLCTVRDMLVVERLSKGRMGRPVDIKGQ